MQRVRGVGVGEAIEGASDECSRMPATGKTRTATREGTSGALHESLGEGSSACLLG
jgi:hypothetical protein